LEDFEALRVGLWRFGEDDLVDLERGLVEDYFGFGFRCKVDYFGGEEVKYDAGVDESADSQRKFEAEVLDDEACDELSERLLHYRNAYKSRFHTLA
jgi:hypothetical protein